MVFIIGEFLSFLTKYLFLLYFSFTFVYIVTLNHCIHVALNLNFKIIYI